MSVIKPPPTAQELVRRYQTKRWSILLIFTGVTLFFKDNPSPAYQRQAILDNTRKGAVHVDPEETLSPLYTKENSDVCLNLAQVSDLYKVYLFGVCASKP